jgi:hypothetical protein
MVQVEVEVEGAVLDVFLDAFELLQAVQVVFWPGR